LNQKSKPDPQLNQSTPYYNTSLVPSMPNKSTTTNHSPDKTVNVTPNSASEEKKSLMP